MTEENTGSQPAPEGQTATITPELIVATPEPSPASTTEPPKVDEPKKDWAIDIITGLRHNIRDTKAENEALKTEIEALKAGKRVESLPEAEIQRRATEIAATNRFNEQCNNIAEKGKESFPTFDAALANLRTVGAIGENSNPAFLQTVAELPEAHKILHHLGNNPSEAARINSLPPLKMAVELAKLETQISSPQPKPISKAPAPITPITPSGGSNGDLASPDISMDEFSKIRQKQREERAKRY